MTYVLLHHPQTLSKLWCQLVTKDNSLAMMGSVSPLMKDVTRYQIAGKKQLFSTYPVSIHADFKEMNLMKMIVRCL